MTEAYLKPGKYTRPRIAMHGVQALVYHWVGNAGTTARQNARYFDSISQSGPRYASYHYIVDTGGEVLQLIPHTEVAWHAGPSRKTAPEIVTALSVLPNYCTVGIAHCHKDWTGEPSTKAYQSMIALGLTLCTQYGLDPETRVYRHHDITGKICPMWYVEHEDRWRRFIWHLSKAVLHGI